MNFLNKAEMLMQCFSFKTASIFFSIIDILTQVDSSFLSTFQRNGSNPIVCSFSTSRIPACLGVVLDAAHAI